MATDVLRRSTCRAALAVALAIGPAAAVMSAEQASADECPDVELALARGTGEPVWPDDAPGSGETRPN